MPPVLGLSLPHTEAIFTLEIQPVPKEMQTHEERTYLVNPCRFFLFRESSTRRMVIAVDERLFLLESFFRNLSYEDNR